MTENIIYPSIDLFVYQLATGLGDDQKKIQANQAAFKNNFSLCNAEDIEKLEDAINQTDRKSSNRVVTPFLTPKHIPLREKEKSEANGEPVDGYYYPVSLLEESYGLLFAVSVEAVSVEAADKIKPQPVSCFQNNLKPLLANKNGNLGKTCILYGYLPPGEDAAQVATNIYKEFMGIEPPPSWQWQQQYQGNPAQGKPNQGKFLGGEIFAAWEPPRNWESLPEYRGLYIILYPNPEPNLQVLHAAAKLYDIWLQLFWFQNKIIWAYDNTRQLKRKLEGDFLAIRETFTKIQEIDTKDGNLDLGSLQELVKEKSKTIASYAANLSLMEIQRQTLEINLHNWKICRSQLQAEAKKLGEEQKLGETDLSFFDTFTEVVENEYLQQVQKDAEIFKPGLQALENLINPLSSIVELTQAERDRHLEKLIAAVGIGVGSAGTVASGSASSIEKLTEPIFTQTQYPVIVKPLYNAVFVVLLSYIVGRIAGYLVWRTWGMSSKKRTST
ncbi:MAG TPA: hypothetical protein IGS52_15810 [Oscillatoriaceae cyanobacterium M33_DOE_052]|uniref:Uncharacterized protein n=1 Tax=Planktothricoides sp. SpSt-374 TaxID=2282167 RepID=A0A7C3VF34_9CYAN|nr:hypothetical protein [Oscillatoriaceae cyanobacterium M33_DOE_052]